MTCNRNRKDKIRQATGTRHAAAARQAGEREQRTRQIHAASLLRPASR